MFSVTVSLLHPLHFSSNLAEIGLHVFMLFSRLLELVLPSNCDLQQTSASLKFTILNPKGRIWKMVVGGGASVIYADTAAEWKRKYEPKRRGMSNWSIKSQCLEGWLMQWQLFV